MITIYAYDWVPGFAKGMVRDYRVRWALEECGLAYQVKTISHTHKLTDEWKSKQPFYQIPVYEEGDLTLFESGAIVQHIAEKGDILLSADPVAREQAKGWIFSALNTVEPPIAQMVATTIMYRKEDWYKGAMTAQEIMIRDRLAHLANYLNGREWLVGAFSAADLLMASVLRQLDSTDWVKSDSVLGPYQKRCLSRPAYRKAIEGQMADFTGSAPPH